MERIVHRDRRRRRLSTLFTGYRPSVRCSLLRNCSSLLVVSLLLWLQASGSTSDELFTDLALLSDRIHEQSLGLNDTVDTALMKQDDGTLTSSTSVQAALQSSLNLKEVTLLNSEETKGLLHETTIQISDLSWSGKVVLSDYPESSTLHNSLEVTPSSESRGTMVTEEYQTTTSLHSITQTSSVILFGLGSSTTRQSSGHPISSALLSSTILGPPVSFLTVSGKPILASSKQPPEPVSPLLSSVAVNNHGTRQPIISTVLTDFDTIESVKEYSETSLLSDIDTTSYRTYVPPHMEDLTGENEMSPTTNGIPLLSSEGKFEVTGKSSVDHVETWVHNALTPELVSERSSTFGLTRLLTSVDAALSDSTSVKDGMILTEFNGPVLSTHLFTSPSTHGAILSPSGLFPTGSFGSDFGSGDDPETTTLSVSRTDRFVPASSLVIDSFDPELLESEVYDTYFPTRLVLTVSSGFAPLSVPSVTFSSYYSRSPATTHPSSQSLYSSFEDNLDINIVSPSLLINETTVLAPTVSEDLPFVVTSMALQPTLSLNENASFPLLVTTRLTDFLTSESPGSTSLFLEEPLDLVSSLLSVLSTESSSVLATEYLSLFEPQLETFAVFQTMTAEKPLSILTLESTFLEPEPKTVNLQAAITDLRDLSVILESSFIKAYSNGTSVTSSLFEAVPPSVVAIQPTLMPSILESTLTDSSTAIADDTAESLVHTLPSLMLISSSFPAPTVAITTDSVVTPNSTVEMSYSSSSTSDPHTFPDVFPSSTETVWIATSFLLTPSPSPIGNSSDPTPKTMLTATTTKIPISNLTATPTNGSVTTSASNAASKPTLPTTARTVVSATAQKFVCDINETDSYLVTAALSNKVTTLQDVVRSIRDVLSQRFKQPVELQVLKANQKLTFMVIAGPVVFSGPAVLNSLARSSLVSSNSPLILSLQPAVTVPDHQAQVQIVLQFVPRYVDVRFCNFTQRIEKGLTMAFGEMRRRRQESEGFTVQVINVTHAAENVGGLGQGPVNITFAINSPRGFLNGSDVSNLLRILNLVEFSFYLGFPVLKTAEPIYYPELNRSYLLKASWIKTVLLGVRDYHIQDKTFQAELERKLAQLIGEAVGSARRWKRASTLGNNTVQVVNITKITGEGNPAELIYFVEKQDGERLSANEAANLINKVDIQRAAIVLGYRIQGALAQPVESVATSSPTDENKNLWIIVAVLVPVIVVVIIIMILYWKFCRTDKLEFQPDTMSNIQQRQKLQVPSVKGFDFAKQHIGQHGKDDILVIHEGHPPVPAKDSTPSENGDVSSPQPKAAKLSKGLRQRSRVSPSEAESTASEQSSGRESIEDIPRPPVIPSGGNRHTVIRNGPPQISRTGEQPSSASIFDHVDRISRSAEAGKRLPSKIQLIAMQPIVAPPLQNPLLPERVAETNKINKEVQRALRQKSEIEHHRNKIRLRAKRKGHYDFPLMDEVGSIDIKERRRVYRRAQVHIDRILDPGVDGPSVLVEPRKSYRIKRSPRQRRRHQVNSSVMDAEKDRLITTDSDGTYKKPPGVNNAAYVRYEEAGMNPPSGAAHLHSHGSGYMQPGDEMRQEQSQQEALYSNRPMYAEEFQTRPSGHNPAYPVSQSRVDGRMGPQPGQMRVGRPGPAGVSGWSPYGLEDGLMRTAPNRESPRTRGHLEYISPLFQMQRMSLCDPSVPSLHLQHSNAQHPASFGSTCTEDLAPGQSSTSLIKAIREELLRLSQKQSAFQNLHS
ncbi:UPF0606 protein KIAA1549 isoform X2 [Heptranchias perlo]|uniref:UPF0606 protein KIAA1549 isoform X2 n=1 Tax=Heptranchias perlo TaxID=212740 RepID=UPI003559FD59